MKTRLIAVRLARRLIAVISVVVAFRLTYYWMLRAFGAYYGRRFPHDGQNALGAFVLALPLAILAALCAPFLWMRATPRWERPTAM